MSQLFPSSKDPGETVTLTFNFSAELGAETISGTPTISVSAASGVDPSPINILNGLLQTSAGKVLQSVQGGIDGVIYRLAVTVQTATRTLVMAGLLQVAKA